MFHGQSKALDRAQGGDTGERIVAFLRGDRWAVDMMAAWARAVAAHEAWGFETPDDIVQATLLALVQNFRRDAFVGGNLRAYVRRIAKNMCVSSYRKLRSRGEHVALEGASVTAPESGDRVEHRAMLARVMEQMGEECRRIVTLAYVHGYSRGEIAGQLGISVEAARVRLFRCIQSSRLMLNGDGP
jgi:RNA polymerase sigma factor (sigma-70 family)